MRWVTVGTKSLLQLSNIEAMTIQKGIFFETVTIVCIFFGYVNPEKCKKLRKYICTFLASIHACDTDVLKFERFNNLQIIGKIIKNAIVFKAVAGNTTVANNTEKLIGTSVNNNAIAKNVDPEIIVPTATKPIFTAVFCTA